MSGVGLYERDYMRKRLGRRDRYLDSRYESVREAPRRGSSWRRTVLVTFLLVFGLLVLPQLTIAGHHWRFWTL